MADYDFYVNTYLGTRIPEKAFSQLAAQAASTLDSYERVYQVTGGAVARQMAICAMAECIHRYEQQSRFTSTSIGQTSVHYDKPRESLQKQLYQAACVYLDIYRGVS